MASKLVSTSCLCSILTIAQGVSGTKFKDLFMPFLDGIIGILQIIRSTYILEYPEIIADRIEVMVLQATLDYMKSITDPVKSYLSNLERFFASNSDCPPMATVSVGTKWVTDHSLGFTDQLEDEIQQAILFMDEADVNTAYIDRMISVFEEVKKTVQEVCGGI